MPAPSHLLPPSCPLRGRSAPGSLLARLCKPPLRGGACSWYLRSSRGGVRAVRETRCVPAGSGAAERRLRAGSARGQRPASFPAQPRAGGSAVDGTRLQRCSRRPRPPLRPALPPDSEPRDFCRADGSVRPSVSAVLTALTAPRPGRAPPGPGPAARCRAFPFWKASLLACPVCFNTILWGLGSPFSDFVLRWVNLDGGRAPWEEASVSPAAARSVRTLGEPGRAAPGHAKPNQACGLPALPAAGGPRGAARLSRVTAPAWAVQPPARCTAEPLPGHQLRPHSWCPICGTLGERMASESRFGHQG